ncbi:MAG: polysaccharide deacetylase family protein [Gammaproteobacteria bacterium]|jgi:peptidoglycan/xylan/chitin deacetylase (PgdA/CDA1 family)
MFKKLFLPFVFVITLLSSSYAFALTENGAIELWKDKVTKYEEGLSHFIQQKHFPYFARQFEEDSSPEPVAVENKAAEPIETIKPTAEITTINSPDTQKIEVPILATVPTTIPSTIPEKTIPTEENKPEVHESAATIPEADINVSTQERRRLRWLAATQRCHGVRHIRTDKKIVALSFDDGPNGKYTEEVLDILAKHNIHATFFVVGEDVAHHADLIKKIYNAHHVIGNHSFSHPNFSTLPSEKVAPELQKNSALIYGMTGAVPALFRPPYGVCSNASAEITAELGYKTILWDDITNDYDIKKTTANKIAADILKLARPGSIIVLHDGGGERSKTVAALSIIIDRLEEKGYSFVTVPELLSIPPYQTTHDEKSTTQNIVEKS